MEHVSAVQRWRAELEAWRLPDALLEAAPEDPYRFDAKLLARDPRDPRTTPTGQQVLAWLPAEGATLLDVGCGPGAVSAAFTGRAAVTGVEPQPHLAAAARAAGLSVVEGRWPDIAGTVAPADVVLCSHVLYDVANIGPFVTALHDHAGAAVVCEMTATHPWTRLAPLYRDLHDLDRPAGPTAQQAAAAIREALDVDVEIQGWHRPAAAYPDLATLVAHTRRQLCVAPDRDAEVESALRRHVDIDVQPDGSVLTGTVDLATLWWRPDA